MLILLFLNITNQTTQSFIMEGLLQHRLVQGRSRQQRARAWFGTLWNQEDIDFVKSLNYKYIIISAPDHTQDGQEHYHCLIQFCNPRRWPGTLTAHWEQAGSIANTRKYVTDKGEPTFEDGQLGINNGEKSDWQMFVKAAKQCGPKELIDGPFSKLYAHYRTFAGEVNRQFRELQIIDGILQNEWWWGPAGSGKTSKAWREYPELYVKPLNKWWDGYDNQEVVLIDDWDPRQECLTQKLKQWADRYPFPAETKGSSMTIRPKKIIVTSNYSIEECFTLSQDIDAIRRRFKVTRFHKELGQ